MREEGGLAADKRFLESAQRGQFIAVIDEPRLGIGWS